MLADFNQHLADNWSEIDNTLMIVKLMSLPASKDVKKTPTVAGWGSMLVGPVRLELTTKGFVARQLSLLSFQASA